MSTWKPLTQQIKAPPNPNEAVVIYRAQSLLTGSSMDLKGETIGPILPYDQALDVLAWAGERVQ